MEFLDYDLQRFINKLLLTYKDNIYVNINNIQLINYIVFNVTNQICNTYSLDKEYEKYMVLNITQYNMTSIIQKYNQVNRLKYQVSKLQRLELPEQRSPEWYALRKGMLTASSLAAALGNDHFKSKNELILEKVESKEIPFIPNPITEWGVKYEEIATKFYESMNNLEIIEFGLIPHPDFTIFGASPDGICSNDSPEEFIGRMLEIKCPPKRRFTKTVPKHYWYQMQGQLECCNLEECDFLQVKICEYGSFDDYVKDENSDMEPNGKTSKGFPKGCTLTYRKKNELKCSYLYPELYLSNDQYKTWIEENRREIENEDHEFVEAKWWYIERYECTLVKRDREWWCTAMEQIYQFYKEVEYYKIHGVEELKRKISSSKSIDISSVEECLL